MYRSLRIAALVLGVSFLFPGSLVQRASAEDAPAKLVEVATVADFDKIIRPAPMPVVVIFVDEDNTPLELTARSSAQHFGDRALIVKVNVKKASPDALSLLGECSNDPHVQTDPGTGMVTCKDEFGSVPLRLRLYFAHGQPVEGSFDVGGDGSSVAELDESIATSIQPILRMFKEQSI